MDPKYCIGCSEIDSCELNPQDIHDDDSNVPCPIWAESCLECTYRCDYVQLVADVDFQKEHPIKQPGYNTEQQISYVEGWRKGLEMAKTILLSALKES